MARGRISVPLTNNKTAFDAIKDQAQEIGFGEWKLKLIIHDGKITGFDEIEVPLMKFREKMKK